MKILFVMNGLTHYYNLVLSKLNLEPNIELVVIVPNQIGSNIGAGVYQTKVGINFKVIELPEERFLGLFSTFRGLASVIELEKPDVVVVIESYLHAFLLDIPVILSRKKVGFKLILKSIPFRLVPYHEARKAILKSGDGFARFPSIVNSFLTWTRVGKLVKLGILYLNKCAYQLPDAHVNYIEAYELWESYGVPWPKIFITRNSPDTDVLLSINSLVEEAGGVLPYNPFRLIHVGRLVEWKRVDMLIHAIGKLKESFPQLELLIIGNGPEEEKLKDLTHQLGLDGSVQFVGGVYDPMLLGKYFKSSAVYVLAGMGGLSINEAMCFGMPILCSVCDGTEKILVHDGQNGRYFIDGDEADLIDKIRWFFNQPNQLEEMGKKSLEIIRTKVNIHTVIEGYQCAFQYVINDKGTTQLSSISDSDELKETFRKSA